MINPSILEYLGKYDKGIVVSVGLNWNDNFYNSIFFYTSDKMVINVEEKMIQDMGCQIEEMIEYKDLMKEIISMVDAYENIIDELDEIKTI